MKYMHRGVQCTRRDAPGEAPLPLGHVPASVAHEPRARADTIDANQTQLGVEAGGTTAPTRRWKLTVDQLVDAMLRCMHRTPASIHMMHTVRLNNRGEQAEISTAKSRKACSQSVLLLCRRLCLLNGYLALPHWHCCHAPSRVKANLRQHLSCHIIRLILQLVVVEYAIETVIHDLLLGVHLFALLREVAEDFCQSFGVHLLVHCPHGDPDLAH
mmetsp:Transcript_39839/g.78040  ORF Transcript_39839/g.78040 Transcript_39839/m.78040 type:complete len:214 (-) Transcript_39839:419-1060(-)